MRAGPVAVVKSLRRLSKPPAETQKSPGQMVGAFHFRVAHPPMDSRYRSDPQSLSAQQHRSAADRKASRMAVR